jgi:hypothetical protein
MRKLTLAALAFVPVVIGGLVYAASSSPELDKAERSIGGSGYVCPVTGEELPCPNCCPLNQKH